MHVLCMYLFLSMLIMFCLTFLSVISLRKFIFLPRSTSLFFAIGTYAQIDAYLLTLDTTNLDTTISNTDYVFAKLVAVCLPWHKTANSADCTNDLSFFY